ncbi:MAG TPA: DUF998 domain-containing protein [Candidatus Saccharimonadales bacterium]|nr:DUF998 domain-containing protein [Candidatus Saccharimonadales bacterium]
MIKKHVEIYAKYAGLATVCFEWLAVILFFLIRPADFNGQNPISYFASLPETRAIFSVCLTIAAVSFWIFTRFHLPKHYAVPVRLFAASMLGYALLALVPYDPNNVASDIIHRILALFFSVTFLAGIYLVGKNNRDAQVRWVSYIAAALSGIILIMFLAFPKSPILLVLEALSAFIGQAWIVWISFHSFAKARTVQTK